MDKAKNKPYSIIPDASQPEEALAQIIDSFKNDHQNEDQLIGEIRMLAKDEAQTFIYLEKIKNYLNPLTWRKLQLSKMK
ncbi:MAG: hypothetical protein AAF363_03415 [Bacteroidota bacterium]